MDMHLKNASDKISDVFFFDDHTTEPHIHWQLLEQYGEIIWGMHECLIKFKKIFILYYIILICVI